MKRGYKVILTSPTWSLGGANMVSANLVRGLIESGVDARILLTRPDYPESMPMERSRRTPFVKLPMRRYATWRERCHALIRYLEEQSPCIYIPNYDWGHSCIGPRLSSRVVIVGIMHSVDPIYFEHLSRLGKYWNAIVTVSGAIAKKAAQSDPELASRIFAIPNGVDIPELYSRRFSEPGAPLKMVFAGRLVHDPKRILDLPKIMEALRALEVPVRLIVTGAGEDEAQLVRMSRPFLESGVMQLTGKLSNERTLEVMQECDLFLLTSEFEGMPMSLLEAMGRGCVPVVSDVSSGVPELIDHGINGFRVPVGDIASFAEYISLLYRDIEKREHMSRLAYEKVAAGGYRIQDMVNSYEEVFHRALSDAESGAYVRPTGAVTTPLGISPWNYRLPDSIVRMVLFAKAMLRHVRSA